MICPGCVGSLAERDSQRDARAALSCVAQAAELLSAHYRQRTEQAEQEADDARATAQSRELDLLLVALRHDAPIPPLASPGLDAVRRLWERSATYRPALLRRERWALLCEVLPEAGVLSQRGSDVAPVTQRVAT